MNNRIINMQARKDAVSGITPAIMLVNPKFAHNVSMVVRLASCYGLEQVWYTGERVSLDLSNRKRMPREERMKGYREVEIINYDRPLDHFSKDVVPVAIEVRENSEPLHYFEHPENAVYVFGQEDGSIPKSVLHKCHKFVVIPVRHCMNLATAVSTVLYDRLFKQYLNGKDEEQLFTTPGSFEHRGYTDFGDDTLVYRV
jgi:tRNA(Leu) C34 or U34 (ribose-2'-O)-methylase TrmL